jgi:molybdate transport system ATP-binding protein
MRLKLEGVRLPLAHYTLALDLDLAATAIGLFGDSGSGKTSLLDLLAGIRKGAEGLIELDGVILQNNSTFLLSNQRGIGYVPQDLALFPHLSVRGNIFYGSRRSAANVLEAIAPDQVIGSLGLGKLLDRRIDDLSGGEKQRVALARAIMSRPRLILLDEPFTALDPKLRQTGVDLVRQLRSEFSIPFLCVSHSRSELQMLCEILIELAAGKVVQTFVPQPMGQEGTKADFSSANRKSP